MSLPVYFRSSCAEDVAQKFDFDSVFIDLFFVTRVNREIGNLYVSLKKTFCIQHLALILFLLNNFSTTKAYVKQPPLHQVFFARAKMGPDAFQFLCVRE